MAESSAYFSVGKKPRVKLLSNNAVYARLLFIYALFYTFAFIVGVIVFHLLNLENSNVINAHINGYFSVDFSKCNSVFECVDFLLDISGVDISHLTVILTAGFTMLVGIIISVLLVFRGFSFGFSASYLTYAMKSNIIVIESPVFSLISFALISELIAVIMIHFSVKTTCFSDDFKALCGIPRRIIKSKALYTQLLRFLIALGAILILNMFRCVV